MLGMLNETQINNLLLSQVIGRIGCSNSKLSYIVPITYVFDGKDIIGQTHEGMKLDMLRLNPSVCFQVDTIMNMANWQSVVIQGVFKELKGKEATVARDYLYDHVLPLMTSSTVHGHEHAVTGKVDDSNTRKPIMYRIKIKEKTGRFEKQ